MGSLCRLLQISWYKVADLFEVFVLSTCVFQSSPLHLKLSLSFTLRQNMRRQLCPPLNLSSGLFRLTFMEYLCANSRRSSVCTPHLLVGTIHQSNARAEPTWITCGRRSSHLFPVRKKKKNSFLLPGYGNMTMTANESRLSSDFGASVSFVRASVCVCVRVCRVDLLDNLRAHFQSHSVWLKSPSGVKFSITLKLQAAHLKLCAISYLIILLKKKISATDVAADELNELVHPLWKSSSAPTCQKTSQTRFLFSLLFCFRLFVIYVFHSLYYFLMNLNSSYSHFGLKQTLFESI